MTAEEKAKITGQQISVGKGSSDQWGCCNACLRYWKDTDDKGTITAATTILEHHVLIIDLRKMIFRLCPDCALDLVSALNKILKTL